MGERRYRRRDGIAPILIFGIIAAVMAALAIGGMLAVGGVGLGMAANSGGGGASAPSGQRVHVRVWQDSASEDGSVPYSPDSTSVASMPDTTATTGSDGHRPVLVREYVYNRPAGESTVEGVGGPYEIEKTQYEDPASGPGAEPGYGPSETAAPTGGDTTATRYEAPPLTAEQLPVESF